MFCVVFWKIPSENLNFAECRWRILGKALTAGVVLDGHASSLAHGGHVPCFAWVLCGLHSAKLRFAKCPVCSTRQTRCWIAKCIIFTVCFFCYTINWLFAKCMKDCIWQNPKFGKQLVSGCGVSNSLSKVLVSMANNHFSGTWCAVDDKDVFDYIRLPPFQIIRHFKNFGESKQSQVWPKL